MADLKIAKPATDAEKKTSNRTISLPAEAVGLHIVAEGACNVCRNPVRAR